MPGSDGRAVRHVLCKALEVKALKTRLATYRLRCIPAKRLVRDDYREKQPGAIWSTTKMKVDSDRIIALAKNAQIALSALLSRALLGISRVVETGRKRAERFVAMAPRQLGALKPFKENLSSSIHRSIMSRRRSEAHNLGADGQYSLAARRSEEVLAEPSMKRPAGVTIIAIATFAGAAILAVGSCVFFFIAVMAIGGETEAIRFPRRLLGWEWLEDFHFWCWREWRGALRWECCNCANGRGFWRLAVSGLEFCAR